MRLITFYILSKVLRPLLFLVISFTWSGVAFGQVTVCASGCNVTTIAAAQQTATATPNEVIQINDNSITNEGLSLGAVNTSLTVQGGGGAITWASSGNTLNIENTLLKPVTIKNLFLQHDTTGAGGLATFKWNGIGVGASIYFSSVTFNNTTASNYNARLSPAFVSTNQCVFDNCLFMGSSTSAHIRIENASDATQSILCKNTLFKIDASLIGVNVVNASAGPAFFSQFCTYVLNSGTIATAVLSPGPVSITNCVFSCGATEITMSGTGANSNFLYCSFNSSPTTLGTGCITGTTLAREFCDRKFYFLSPAAQSRNSGISISGITGSTVRNGVIRGNGCTAGNDDMGYTPYSPALCGGYGTGK